MPPGSDGAAVAGAHDQGGDQMDARTVWAIGMTAVFVGAPLAVIFAVVWWLSLRRVALAARLVAAEGTLQAFDVERKSQPKGGSYYVIRCRYDYEVGGRRYTGTRAALEFNNYPSEEAARAKLAGKKVGDPVAVWYDPAAPDTAVLEKSPPRWLALYKWLTAAAAAAAVVGGIAAVATMDSA